MKSKIVGDFTEDKKLNTLSLDELKERKKEIGKRIADINTIIQEKKARKEDCRTEIEMKSFYERELFPIKELISKMGVSFNDAYLKVVQNALPNDVKIKLEAITYRAMESKIKYHEIGQEFKFSLYNESDLEILSMKYPKLLADYNKMISAASKQQIEARKLMTLLNSRLTPDEQELVKEVKEFLSKIVNNK